MSDEKCFCHFGGYAVKDATARRKLDNTAKIAALGATTAGTPNGYGFGTCIVMHDADNCIVFDFGSDGGVTLENYLQENTIRKIDAIYISHVHDDHFQLETLQALIANHTVNNVVFPHTAIDWDDLSEANKGYLQLYNNAKAAVRAAAINCIEPTEEGEDAAYGEFVVSCHNVSPDNLGDYYDWSYNEVYTDSGVENYNNFSMVNVVSYRGQKIVVTGDIMEPAQENMVDVLSLADLIFVPHHGLDLMMAHNLINRLNAKHAVINCYWKQFMDHIMQTSNAFAGELIRRGCRVTTTYSPGAAVNAVYSVGLAGITPIEPGALPGQNIYPCILEPETNLNDLPDGEFITYSEDHAKTMGNLPVMFHRDTGVKFKIKTETTGEGSTAERCQTLRTVDTSQTPQIAYRNMVGNTWGHWAVENPAMLPNVEYRTTELWNGKAVFKKLLTYTNEETISGNADIEVPHGIEGIGYLIGVRGLTKNNGYLIPYLSDTTSLAIPCYTQQNIILRTSGSEWAAGREWFFELSYTK